MRLLSQDVANGKLRDKSAMPIYMCTCPDCFTSPLVPRYGTARALRQLEWPPYPSFPLLPLSFRFPQWTDAVTYKESTGEPLRDTLMMPATLAAPSHYAQRSLEEGPDAEWQNVQSGSGILASTERVALLFGGGRPSPFGSPERGCEMIRRADCRG